MEDWRWFFENDVVFVWIYFFCNRLCLTRWHFVSFLNRSEMQGVIEWRKFSVYILACLVIQVLLIVDDTTAIAPTGILGQWIEPFWTAIICPYSVINITDIILFLKFYAIYCETKNAFQKELFSRISKIESPDYVLISFESNRTPCPK